MRPSEKKTCSICNEEKEISKGNTCKDCLAWIMHEEPILGETQEPPCGTNVVPTTF